MCCTHIHRWYLTIHKRTQHLWILHMFHRYPPSWLNELPCCRKWTYPPLPVKAGQAVGNGNSTISSLYLMIPISYPRTHGTHTLTLIWICIYLIHRASSGSRYSFPGAVSNGIPKALPNMTLQKGSFEGENLKLHLCNGVFEAYSASYLTTKEHMIHVNSESFNLTWVNCEMASFIHMKEGRNFFSNPFAHGMVIQVHAPSVTHPLNIS